MSTEPLVSVILPTRNRAELLRRSVASVLSQTYRNLELIVVDDASTDHTSTVLAEFDDPRVRVLRREVNQGAGAARNAGVRLARGELIAFQDDDDCWFVHKLQRQVEALNKAGPGVGWCLAGFVCLRPDACTYIGGAHFFSQIHYGHRPGTPGTDKRLIATPAWLVRREALERAGPFDERLRSWDDWELGLRLDGVTRCVHIDEPLFLQDQVQGGGMTKLQRGRIEDVRLIIEKHADLWKRNPGLLANHYYFVGRGLSLLDPAPAGRRELLHALRLRPLRLRTWYALLLSFMGRSAAQRASDLARRARSTVRAG